MPKMRHVQSWVVCCAACGGGDVYFDTVLDPAIAICRVCGWRGDAEEHKKPVELLVPERECPN